MKTRERRQLGPLSLSANMSVQVQERMMGGLALMVLITGLAGVVGYKAASVAPVVVAVLVPLSVFLAVTMGRKPNRVVMSDDSVQLDRALRDVTVHVDDIEKVVLLERYEHPGVGLGSRLVVVGVEGQPRFTMTSPFWPQHALDEVRQRFVMAGVPVERLKDRVGVAELTERAPELVTWWDRNSRYLLGVCLVGAAVAQAAAAFLVS